MLRRVALVAVLALVGAGCDWTSFGYNAAHTRYNPTETAIGVDNVAGLVTAWTGTTGDYIQSSPAIAKGVAYVGSADGKLYAFSANGSTGCVGSPKTCLPLWTAATGALVDSSPAVANGVVYVGSRDSKVYAFDAAGSTGCSGKPKTCVPLWTATTFADIFSSPTVVNGVVYIGSSDGRLYAYDAAGSTGCSGTPKTCVPLWSALTGGNDVFSSPAVANGVVYVGPDNGRLNAYDAAGSIGCSGAPKTCVPLWTGDVGENGDIVVVSTAAVANGVVYVNSAAGNLYAFDASAPSTQCGGTPKTCSPLWLAPSGGIASPAVANGVVYVGSTDYHLYAFDASGPPSHCSGAPKVCTPLWAAAAGSQVNSSPAVANGVVYVGSADNKLYAFDAVGSIGCSGAPTACTPLWTATTGAAVSSSPAIANGVVYVGSVDGKLYAFAP